MSIFTAFLEKKEPIGSQTIQLTVKFSPQSIFEFQPGQYIWLVLPKLDFPDPKGERRAFSITSSSAEKNQITILVKISDSGFKKTLINLPENSPLQVIGPSGSSYLINSESGNIVMIAGGTGIAPFSGILRSLKNYPSLPNLKIIYCSFSTDTSCFTPDLDQICAQNNIPVAKHLGDFRENIIPPGIDYGNDVFFISGPEGLVNSVCNALFSKNVPLSRIRLEQFYPPTPGNLTEEMLLEKIGENNIMFQAIQDSKNHVVITDTNGKIIFANIAAQKNTGFTFNEMRGNTPRLWGGVMSVDFYSGFWQREVKVAGFDGTLTNRRKNNELYNVIAHISPIFGENKKIAGYIGTEEDITKNINLENQLKNRNELLALEKQQDETILNSIGDGVVVVDINGVIIIANPAALEMLKVNRNEFIGKRFIDLVPSEDEKGDRNTVQKRLETLGIGENKKISEIVTYIRKDGTKFVVNAINTPVIIEGKLFGYVISFRDITVEREIDKSKTEFISLASHQLRTPLSTINWYLEMLLTEDKAELNDDQKEYVIEAASASKRMVGLVDALLNVSRIEMGTFTILPVSINVIEIIKAVISECNHKISDKKLEIIENYDPSVPEVLADPKLSEIVIQNLLENAINYTPENGKIKVSVAKKISDILITVEDTGIGIPKNQQTMIFNKLFRADNARVNLPNGNGLGLYMTKSIIEHSGGKIWFESQESKGTTFYVSIPLSGMKAKEGTKQLS